MRVGAVPVAVSRYRRDLQPFQHLGGAWDGGMTAALGEQESKRLGSDRRSGEDHVAFYFTVGIPDHDSAARGKLGDRLLGTGAPGDVTSPAQRSRRARASDARGTMA
jgi:hypothetical protein